MFPRLILLGGLLTAAGWSQIAYVAQKTTVLAGAAEVITVQQPSSGSKLVEFASAYIDCSVACTATLERNGPPASTTALTPRNINPLETASVSSAFSASNVGTGSVLQVSAVGAGSYIVFDLAGIKLPANNDRGQNFSIRTSSITGTVNITVKWTER